MFVGYRRAYVLPPPRALVATRVVAETLTESPAPTAMAACPRRPSSIPPGSCGTRLLRRGSPIGCCGLLGPSPRSNAAQPLPLSLSRCMLPLGWILHLFWFRYAVYRGSSKNQPSHPIPWFSPDQVFRRNATFLLARASPQNESGGQKTSRDEPRYEASHCDLEVTFRC